MLVERFSSLVEGHVEAFVDVNDALLLHAGEHDCGLDILPRCLLSLSELLLKLLELGQLHLDVDLLLLLREIVSCLLFGSSAPFLPQI